MKQITNFDISRLRTEEDFGFQKRVETAALAMLDQESDKAMVDAYVAALTQFDAALKQSQKNSQTEAVTEADAAFDALYTNAYALARILPAHPTAAAAEAGKVILAMFDKYGSITRMGYNEEYGAAHNLLQDLATLTADQLTATAFTPWLEALNLACARFQIARESKATEDAARVTGLVKDARTAADTAYKTLVQKVNALCVVMGEEHYAPFIDQVNVYVADAQATLKSRATRSANKSTEEGEESTENGEQSTDTDTDTSNEYPIE